MNEACQPRAARITSWLLLGISAVLCASTLYLLDLYATVHWRVGPCAARLRLDAQEMRQLLKEGVCRDGGEPVTAADSYLAIISLVCLAFSSRSVASRAAPDGSASSLCCQVWHPCSWPSW